MKEIVSNCKVYEKIRAFPSQYCVNLNSKGLKKFIDLLIQ